MNISTLLQGLATFAWIGFFGVLVLILSLIHISEPTRPY